MKTFKIYTLGCKVNQYESQVMRENLTQSGAIEENKNSKSDIYVINTCTVTNLADKKSLYFINKSFNANSKAKILVTGCLTEKDRGKIISKFGNSVEIVKNNQKNNIGRDAKFCVSTISGISDFRGHDRAFLKIQDGCDNFCSYCKVPLVRGKPKSRALNEIIDEAKRVIDNGFKEIVLTGICLGSYGLDLAEKIKLLDVLKALLEIKNTPKIRLSSIEAKDVDKELIFLIRDSRFICKHLHLPLQAGDDGILKKMNRGFLTAGYLKLIKFIKEEIPQISITTDIIVGFPGEKDKDFKNTVKFLNKVKPSRTHIFSYSDRPGTKAVEFYPKVSSDIISKRFYQLKRLADKFSYEYRKKFLNKKAEILVESVLDKKTGLQTGYTDNYIKVLINSRKNLKNKLISLKINKVTKDNCYAKYAG